MDGEGWLNQICVKAASTQTVWDAELVLIETQKKMEFLFNICVTSRFREYIMLHKAGEKDLYATFHLGCVPILKKQK